MEPIKTADCTGKGVRPSLRLAVIQPALYAASMVCRIALTLAWGLAAVPAQVLQFSHEIGANSHLGAPGPVTLPVSVWSSGAGWSSSLGVGQVGSTLHAGGYGATAITTGAGGTSDMISTVASTVPKRVECVVTHTFSASGSSTPKPSSSTAIVDVGDDGAAEFTSSSPAPGAATLALFCDRRGTKVHWRFSFGIYSVVTSAQGGLTLEFVEPVSEATYGPNCAGELGCQVGSSPFDRIFVASLPSDTTFAWLMGGDRSWNVQFPSFPCPVLVEPQFILAVPLHDGPNDRKFVDFEAAFPSIPGLSFYAQGIAISGGTFIGTNGVVIDL